MRFSTRKFTRLLCYGNLECFCARPVAHFLAVRTDERDMPAAALPIHRVTRDADKFFLAGSGLHRFVHRRHVV